MPGTSSPIVRDTEILGGIPVFAGTRVPVRNLIDSLEAGDTLDTLMLRAMESRVVAAE